MPQTKTRSGAPEALAKPPEDFESAIEELERLVAAMEGGALSLEASLAAY